MGRSGGKKRRKKRGGGRRKSHESGPESAVGTDLNPTSCSPTWNSLDEAALDDYAQNAACEYGWGEEEVAKRLSYLNFSVVPCAVEPHNLECAPYAPAPPSDVDLLSELTSATHLEREDGGNDGGGRKEGRKRISRRRPNKRAKKMRSGTSCVCHFVREAVSPPADALACQRCQVKTSRTTRRQKDADCLPSSQERNALGGSANAGSVANRSESSTPVNLPPSSLACLVDMECEAAGVMVCPLDNPMAVGEKETTAGARELDHRSVAQLATVEMGLVEELLSDEESDLSETSTDSGCDGDDEESSVERRGTLHFIPAWWERELPSPSSDDDSDSDQFLSILKGAYPREAHCYPQLPQISPERRGAGRSLKERLHLSEFKHPGKLGIRGGGARKKRSKPLQSAPGLSPAEVNSQIADFVKDASETHLRFELVSRAHCRTISLLAGAYQLHCEVEQQRRRLPVATPLLRKTGFTRMASWDEVDSILHSHGSTIGVTFPFPHSHSVGVVGGCAQPLDESNLGNRMLRGMGWRPGAGLGPEGEGIQEPVVAQMRPRRSGLGF